MTADDIPTLEEVLNSEMDARFNAAVPSELLERAKERTEHGELSRAARELLYELAYGEGSASEDPTRVELRRAFEERERAERGERIARAKKEYCDVKMARLEDELRSLESP